MSEPNTLFQGIKFHIAQSGLVGGRIFRADSIPPTTPTFPFIGIQFFDNSAVQKGDGGEDVQLKQLVQVDLWQESLKLQDVSLPGQFARLLRTFQVVLPGGNVWVRFESINPVPTPDNEVALHHAITLSAYQPIEAI